MLIGDIGGFVAVGFEVEQGEFDLLGRGFSGAAVSADVVASVVSTRREFEQAAESSFQTLEFIVRQCAETLLQTDDGNGLNLLEMKRTGFQKRFGNVQLPAIVPSGRRMGNDHDQRQFVLRGEIA